MIEKIVNVLRELKKQGYDYKGSYHIRCSVILTEELSINLKGLRSYPLIDFNLDDLWEYIDELGTKIDVDFTILSECPLKIYQTTDVFFRSKTSITSSLYLRNNFYIFSDDCYYGNNNHHDIKGDTGEQESKGDLIKKINNILILSKFIFKLISENKNEENILNNKIYIKNKVVNIDFSYKSLLLIDKVEISFIMDIQREEYGLYRFEKQCLFRNALIDNIETTSNIDMIIEMWTHIYTIYENKLSHLISSYSLRKKELEIYNVKVDFLKKYSDLLSNLINKLFLIPIPMFSSIVLDSYMQNKVIMTFVLIGMLFLFIPLWKVVSQQKSISEELLEDHRSIIRDLQNYQGLTRKIENINILIVKKEKILNSTISFIRSCIVTIVIILVFYYIYTLM